METGVPLVQKTVFGKMECFTKDVGATRAGLVRFLVNVQLHNTFQNLVLGLEIGECLCLKALADPLLVTIRKRSRNPKLQRHLQKLLRKPRFRLEEEFRQPWQELRL